MQGARHATRAAKEACVACSRLKIVTRFHDFYHFHHSLPLLPLCPRQPILIPPPLQLPLAQPYSSIINSTSRVKWDRTPVFTPPSTPPNFTTSPHPSLDFHLHAMSGHARASTLHFPPRPSIKRAQPGERKRHPTNASCSLRNPNCMYNPILSFLTSTVTQCPCQPLSSCPSEPREQ